MCQILKMALVRIKENEDRAGEELKPETAKVFYFLFLCLEPKLSASDLLLIPLEMRIALLGVLTILPSKNQLMVALACPDVVIFFFSTQIFNCDSNNLANRLKRMPGALITASGTD